MKQLVFLTFCLGLTLANGHHRFFHARHSSESCGWVCPNSTQEAQDIQVVINVKASVFGLANTTANLGVVFDVQANLLGFFNGTSGHGIVVNIATQTGVYITDQKSPLLWVQAQVSFEAYINSLKSLKELIDNSDDKTSVKFTAKHPPQEVLQHCADTFFVFGARFGIDIKADLSDALDLVIVLGRVNSYLSGNLKGLFKLVTQTTFRGRITLSSVYERIEGLSKFISQAKGGLQEFEEKKIKIELSVVLTASTGIEIVTYLFQQKVDGGIDIVKNLNKGKFDFQQIIKAMLQFDGLHSKGVSALGRVAFLTIRLANKCADIDEYIEALVNAAVTEVKEDLAQKGKTTITQLISVLETATKKNSKAKEALDKFKQWRDDKLIIGKVNVSQVLEHLRKFNSVKPIQFIVQALVDVRKEVPLETSVPHLLYYLICKLNSNSGIYTIVKLLPDLDIDLQKYGNRNNLEEILKQVNINDILGGGLNIEKILKNLPVIGRIYSAIEDSLKSATDGQFEFGRVIQSSGASGIVRRILQLLSGASHFNFEAEVHIGSHVTSEQSKKLEKQKRLHY